MNVAASLLKIHSKKSLMEKQIPPHKVISCLVNIASVQNAEVSAWRGDIVKSLEEDCRPGVALCQPVPSPPKRAAFPLQQMAALIRPRSAFNWKPQDAARLAFESIRFWRGDGAN